MKTLKSLFLLFAAFLVCSQIRAFEVDGISYVPSRGNSVFVEKGATPYAGDIKIPSTVTFNGETYNVTGIEEGAFRSCDQLRSVDIGEVSYIAPYAFYECTALEKINLDKVGHVGYSAFARCKSLKHINLSSVRTIEFDAFSYCSQLESVYLTHGPFPISLIGGQAFDGCNKLQSLDVVDVEKIENDAFAGVTNLILRRVGSIDEDVFRGNVKSVILMNEQVPPVCIESQTDDDNVFSFGSAGNMPIIVDWKYNYKNTDWWSLNLFEGYRFMNFENEVVECNVGDIGAADEFSHLAGNEIIAWESSDPSVVDINNNGRYKAFKSGIAFITATSSVGTKASATFIVGGGSYVKTEAVIYDKSEITLKSGVSEFIHARVVPENASNREVAYFSMDKAIAVVDQDGKVTGVAPGETCIIAVSKDGSDVMSSCLVHVEYHDNGLSHQVVRCNSGDRGKITSTDYSPRQSWTSSNPEIVEINEKGEYHALKKGTVQICTDVGPNIVRHKLYCTIVVDGSPFIPISAISLPENLTLNKSQRTYQLRAKIEPAEGVTFPDLDWRSDDKSVVRVSETGLVTVVGTGSTYVTAESADGMAVKASCLVTVNKQQFTEFQSTPAMVRCKGWDTGKIVPSSKLSGAISWKSSNPNVVAHMGHGDYEARDHGVAQLIATDEHGMSSYTTFVVEDEYYSPEFVDFVEIDQPQLQLNVADQIQLHAEVYPTNTEFPMVQWWSDNPAVAKVDKNGNVTGVGIGTANVYVLSTDGYAVYESCKVTVNTKSSLFTLTETSLTLGIYDRTQLHPCLNGKPIDGASVQWSTDQPGVVSVDRNGVLTPVGPGTSLVTAAYVSNNGNKLSATCQVTVDEVEIRADMQYVNTEDISLRNLYYIRNFDNQEWQDLYIPFAMTYDEWSPFVSIARINNFHQYDSNQDGYVDSNVLEAFILPRGSRIEANTPYLVKAKGIGEKRMVIENALLKKAESNRIDCSSVNTHYVFVGTSEGVSVDYLIENQCYIIKFNCLQPAFFGDSDLHGLHWYMKMEDRNGGIVSTTNKISILVLGEENDEITGLEESMNSECQSNSIWPADIYDLQGKLVKNDAGSMEGLSKGIYIVNGKKIIKSK